MGFMLVSSAIDHGFEPCFSTKHAALNNKNQDWESG
jgi:hypothetical protein